MKSDYYVYVYIDPRNFEEFYYGKGTGSRKYAHLSDESDSKKARRIKAIAKEGLQPIIKVIARGLTEHDALLVEKTLLWKLGKQLDNLATGSYSDNFRPHDTLHLDVSGFDYQNGVYYYNVGEGPHRNWDDYRQYGFISAGQGTRWRDAMLGFNRGDVVVAYLKRHGFVGIGKIQETAKPIRSVSIKGIPLLQVDLRCDNMADNMGSDELCEYVCLVEWLKTVGRDEAKWKSNAGLFTPQLVRASLDSQQPTIDFLDGQFGLDIRNLVR